MFPAFQLSNIVHANNCLEDAMQKGAKLADVMAMWDHLQTQCATVITSDLPLQTTGNSKMRGKKKKQVHMASVVCVLVCACVCVCMRKAGG